MTQAEVGKRQQKTSTCTFSHFYLVSAPDHEPARSLSDGEMIPYSAHLTGSHRQLPGFELFAHSAYVKAFTQKLHMA